MTLDLDAIKAHLARAFDDCDMVHTEPYDFAWCGTHDETFPVGGRCPYSYALALVAEVERLRSVPEPDNHHNAYACPHCEAPIHAVEAERDRYRAEWEEAARHALRWQAEYDTAQQEIERLHFAIDGLAANAAGYQRGEVEQAGQARRAERERDDDEAAGQDRRTTIDPITHDPCCSSHGKALTCVQYRRTHFVEVRPCCEHDRALCLTRFPKKTPEAWEHVIRADERTTQTRKETS